MVAKCATSQWKVYVILLNHYRRSSWPNCDFDLLKGSVKAGIPLVIVYIQGMPYQL